VICVYCGIETGNAYDEHQACVEEALVEAVGDDAGAAITVNGELVGYGRPGMVRALARMVATRP
jgi:hypothetical protein